MTFHQISVTESSLECFLVSSSRWYHADRSRKHEHSRERNSGDDLQLSLRQTDVLQISTGSSANALLRSKSELKIKQSDDGSIAFKFKSKLKFDYEFQSEDGTSIKISAKIKSRISYSENNGEQSVKLKSRVKFQLSATLKSVQSGVAPALGSENVSDEQNSEIATALQGFSDLIDRLSSEFQGDAIDGDDLIVSIVNAFNELSGSVQSNLPEDSAGPATQPELPAIDLAADESESPAADLLAAPGEPAVMPQKSPRKSRATLA